MARYGRAFRERAVARLLPPESSPVETVSREIGVSVATLERWRADALSLPDGKQWDGLLLTLTYRRRCARMVSANQPFRE
jgi:hypothetical protein